MTPQEVEQQLELANKSFDGQRKANQAMLDSNLDAADRILLRKAADVSIKLAEAASLGGENPT